MASNNDQFNFDYAKYKSSSITLEQVDNLEKAAAESATNPVSQVFLMIRIAVLVGCAWLRKRIIDEEMLIQKQEYETRRNQQSSGTLAKDDLDQLRSKT